MKNRISVVIAGQEYTITSNEKREYMERVASHVDRQIAEVNRSSHIALLDAAVLAALNITDEYMKSVENADNLRQQLQDFLEEITSLKAELSETKRELSRLKAK